MSLTDSNPIIEFDVVLKARVEEPNDVPEPEAPGGDGDQFDEHVKSFKSSKTSEQGAKVKELEDLVSKLDAKGTAELKALVSNPKQMIQKNTLAMMRGAIGKAGIVGAIIAIVLSAPEIFIKLVELLGQRGGPLNQDYTRELANDVQLGIDKDLQFRRAIGIDVVITSEDTKYIISDPAFVNNSLVDVDKTRSIRLNSNESQYGYVSGL